MIEDAERTGGGNAIESVWAANAQLIYDFRGAGLAAEADGLAAFYAERLANAVGHEGDSTTAPVVEAGADPDDFWSRADLRIEAPTVSGTTRIDLAKLTAILCNLAAAGPSEADLDRLLRDNRAYMNQLVGYKQEGYKVNAAADVHAAVAARRKVLAG